MAHTRYATDRGLIARMGATMFLIGLVFVAFIAALVYLFGAFSNISTGGIVFLAVAAALAVSLGSYFLSDKIALSTSGARLVTPQHPKIIATCGSAASVPGPPMFTWRSPARVLRSARRWGPGHRRDHQRNRRIPVPRDGGGPGHRTRPDR